MNALGNKPVISSAVNKTKCTAYETTHFLPLSVNTAPVTLNWTMPYPLKSIMCFRVQVEVIATTMDTMIIGGNPNLSM